MKVDIIKIDGKKAGNMSLNDNVSWMTALGNDYDYEDIYQQQLVNFAKSNDLLLVLSVSGNSPNVVKAMSWAKENGVTPLWIACQEGQVTLARMLLDKGAEVDRAKNDGATPLHVACLKGHVDVASRAGNEQRRHAVPQRPVDLRAVFQQVPRRVNVAVVAGGVQRIDQRPVRLHAPNRSWDRISRRRPRS